MDFFKGRQLVIATKHGKEQVIAPILEQGLGLHCLTLPDLDTDRLGTFSGEVERRLDPIETLRQKCLMAMEISGLKLALASEGSFGPHPAAFFAPANEELLMLLDQERGLEIVVRELSLETNFAASPIHSEQELHRFAQKIGFPEHGLILKRAKDNYQGLIKDNPSMEALLQNYRLIQEPDGSAYAETDMRAMRNPSRLKVIAKAAEQLLQRLQALCPACQCPGFAVAEVISGLPCEWCYQPTRAALKHHYRCQACQFEEERLYPLGKTEESAQYCDYCNP